MPWKCVKYLLAQHSHIKRGLDPAQKNITIHHLMIHDYVL